MKILILGAKGSLGQTFVDVYSDQKVIAWDREELDITNESEVLDKITELAPNLIINCAAYNAVDKAEEDREIANQINGYAVGFIGKAADAIGATLVHYSTSYVFDGQNSAGYGENDLPRPQSAYAKSKLLGEMELQENCQNFYLIRTQWLYGRASENGKPSFVETMLKLALSGQSIESINDEFGQPTYVLDLASATRALIEDQKPFKTYHLINSGSATWFDWAREIFKIKNLEIKLNPVSRANFVRKAPRPQYGILHNTKFIELRPWHEALEEYLNSASSK